METEEVKEVETDDMLDDSIDMPADSMPIDMPDLAGEIDPALDGEIEFLIDPDNIINDDAGDEEEDGVMIPPANLGELEKIITGDFGETPDPELEEEDSDEMPEVQAVPKVAVKDWTCTSCYVKVAPAQFGPANNRACPQGQSICPAVDKFF